MLGEVLVVVVGRAGARGGGRHHHHRHRRRDVVGMVVADAVRGRRHRTRWSWGWESLPLPSRCYGGGHHRRMTLGMGWSSWMVLVLGVVRRCWRWGSSSSDDAGTEGGGGGGGRHCQDAVGVVDDVAVEMLWGVVIVGRRWRWDGCPGRRWRWGSSLSNDAGGWGSLLSLLNDAEGWGWSSLLSHDTGDEGRCHGRRWSWARHHCRR